jgi:hypothetical protein
VVVLDVVVAVSVEVTAVVLVMEAEVGERLQVGALVGFDSEVVTAQVSATVPVKEFDGVTVIVEVLPLVAPGLTVIEPLLLRAKLLLLTGSQKPLQPARSVTPASNSRAHLPILIAAPFRSNAGFLTLRVLLPRRPCLAAGPLGTQMEPTQCTDRRAPERMRSPE